MAKQYEVTGALRAVNVLMNALTRVGLGPKSYRRLTTTGRTTGKPRTTPIDLETHDGVDYVVAPYGVVGWVHNARAADGAARLSRGISRRDVKLVEVDARAAGPILQSYMRRIKIVQPYFDADPDDGVEVFVAEAHRHPVFRVEYADQA